MGVVILEMSAMVRISILSISIQFFYWPTISTIVSFICSAGQPFLPAVHCRGSVEGADLQVVLESLG